MWNFKEGSSKTIYPNIMYIMFTHTRNSSLYLYPTDLYVKGSKWGRLLWPFRNQRGLYIHIIPLTKLPFPVTWCFSDRASWIDYILITNLMHWLLFIHKILFSCTCFEPQVLIFRRIQLYTCSIWYCHSLWEFVVACRYTAVYRQATRNSHREWQYHMLHVYNCILLKMSTW